MSEVSLERRPLPVGSIEIRSVGYWGMVGFILTEASLCVYLEFSHYYYAVQPHVGPWPPGGVPDLRYALPATIVLVVNAAALAWAERAIVRGRVLATTSPWRSHCCSAWPLSRLRPSNGKARPSASEAVPTVRCFSAVKASTWPTRCWVS